MLKLPDNRIYVPNSGKCINGIFTSYCSPVPTITWMKVNGYIPSKSRLAELASSTGSLTCSWTMQALYECRAENSRGKNTFRGQLQVYSKCSQQSLMPWVTRVKLKCNLN